MPDPNGQIMLLEDFAFCYVDLKEIASISDGFYSQFE